MTPSKPVLVPPGEGDALWFFGGLLTFKATMAQTGGEFVVAEQLFPRGMATPMHIQPTESSSWYVLDGQLTFYCADGRPRTAMAGSFVHVPAGAPHAFRVESETARMLNINTPQHEEFFRAAGAPAPARVLPAPDDPRGRVDMDRVGAAADRFGVEITGPPPENSEPDALGPPAVVSTAY